MSEKKEPEKKEEKKKDEGMTLRKAAKLGSLWTESKSENKAKKNQWFMDTSARTQEGDGSKRDGREIAQGGRGMERVFNRNRAQEKFRQKFGKYKFVSQRLTSEETEMKNEINESHKKREIEITTRPWHGLSPLKYPPIMSQKEKDDMKKAFVVKPKKTTNETTDAENTDTETIELNELTKKTLGSYVKKASQDVASHSAAVGRFSVYHRNRMEKDGTMNTPTANHGRVADKAFDKSWKRRMGISKAVDKLTKEDVDMENLEESRWGATHEFRGNEAFMEKCAEKIFKKHGIQVHSKEILPDEKEVIFHVSGSVDALHKASTALWDESYEEGPKPKVTAYKPPKFQGQTKKMVMEETETGEEMETEEEMSTEEILEAGPAAILSSIASDSEDKDEIFQTVMGAKIDSILDGLKSELAAGMFDTQEEEVTTENLIAVLSDVGVELTEEQLEEAKLTGEGRKISTSDANAHKAQEAEHRGDFAGAKVFWKRAGLNRLGTKHGSAANLKLQIRGKSVRKEDISDILSSFGINLNEEQLEIAEASLWKPQAAGFTKKGIAPKKGLKKTGEYDKKAHEKSSSASMVDQMTAKNR